MKYIKKLTFSNNTAWLLRLSKYKIKKNRLATKIFDQVKR